MNFFLFAFLLPLIGCVSGFKCDLPTSDQSRASSSSFFGIVVMVDAENKTATARHYKKIVVVDFKTLNKTNLFSQFGGLIEMEEIKIGDKIEVWGKFCSPVINENIEAAAVKVYK